MVRRDSSHRYDGEEEQPASPLMARRSMCHNDEEGAHSVCYNKVKAATSSATTKEWPLHLPDDEEGQSTGHGRTPPDTAILIAKVDET